DPREWNQTVMEAVVEADESLMERHLEGEELSTAEVGGAFSKAMIAGTLVPIVCCSSKTGTGVDELLEVLANFTPAPADVPRVATPPSEGGVTLDQSPRAPLVAQVYKTRIDPFVGKMFSLRVFSGRLKKDASVYATGANRPVKIGQLLCVQGGKTEPVDECVAGDIAAVVKVEELSPGATLTAESGGPQMPPIAFPTPMIGQAVEPKSRADQTKISGALQKVVEEDPTFKIYRDPQTKEMVMQGISELHLQIVQNRLKSREKVEILTKPPKIPYRETVSGSAEGFYRHKKQTGGSGQFAEVHFRIAPVPRDVNPEEFFTSDRFVSLRDYDYDPDLNFAFIDSVTGGSVPNNFIPAVKKGIRERMEKGVIAGYQVQDCSCALFFGKDHPVDSNETAFKTAASMCFRNVFKEARPTLLEPIVTAEITVPGDKLGDITSDLNSRRGRVEGLEGAAGGYQIIHAKAPLAEVMTYARSLSSMTGGQGSFTIEFSHYEMVPPNEQQKIVAAAQKEEEEG
ncbi:MAG: elongation factor G, partial [Planctomycetaceae bacterium]